MTRAHLPGSFRNSTNVVWINTELHRCTQMEDDTSYHAETLHQGRDLTNPVPRYSMLAGKPDQDDVDNETRAIFWRSYTATVALVLLCVVVLANWPN